MRRFLFIIENGQIANDRELQPQEFFEKEIEFDHSTQRLISIIVKASNWEEAREKANDILDRSNRNR